MSDPSHALSKIERGAELASLDPLLFNSTADAYGAPVGVDLGEGRVIHLSQRIDAPMI